MTGQTRLFGTGQLLGTKLLKMDNTKGWKGTKSNVDGSAHSDTATYDWNGSANGFE